MKQSGMPSRSAPMRLCGKAYASAGEAGRSKAAQRPGAVIDVKCPCGGVHVRQPRATVRALPSRPRGTGFSARVKLQVRARAGNGCVDDARCEACGVFLGRYGGQVHHIIDRGMGGCALAVINGTANAALLCGTPQDKTTCHGRATAFDEEIGKWGFWLKHTADSRREPMQLFSPRGRFTVWRSEDGRYLTACPELGEAA